MATNNKEQAYERGEQAGWAHADCLWDGNTTTETYLEFLRRDADCDLPDDYYPPAPLSGEWAGESPTEILWGLVDDEAYIDELMDAYEDGFYSGWWTRLQEVATYMTQHLEQEEVRA